MGRSVILSEETVSTLLEAHASLAAWYYELVRALQSQSPPVMPDEATRLAFLTRLAQDFPEIAAVASSIKAPRTYVPPPPAFAVPPPRPAPSVVITEAPHPSPFPAAASPVPAPPSAPPAAAAPASTGAPAAAAAPPSAVAVAVPPPPPPPPPPLVVPGTVKYE